MRPSALVFCSALAVGCSAIALSGGCSSAETHGQAPPLAGGTGGAGGEVATSSSHSSSHASTSSSHASSSSSTGTAGSGTGGAGGGGTGGSNLPAHCTDLVKDDGETDVDCGGACAPCGDNDACLVASDCQSLHCVASKCVPATCSDGIKNQGETDTDCGGVGNTCARCTAGATCVAGTDCIDKICTLGTCALHTCSDHQQNGTESDIDCGGNCPNECDPGQKCNTPADCRGGQCQSTCQCPQGMVIVPVGGGGAEYCIDAIEVTYAAYQVFYDSNPDTTSQPAFCQWNDNYTPTGDWPQLSQNAQQAIRFVNWCQADAYCRFAGKRLCGNIQGGSGDAADLDNAAKDQWFNACSAQGVNDYPYGDTFKPTACDGLPAGLPGPWSTPTQTCLGGEPNLFDMSGDVAEWEDACNGMVDENDSCPVRGGAYDSDSTDLRCDSGGTADLLPRDYAGRDVGFRCCF